MRPGGAIRIDMRGPDGIVHETSGVLREVVEPGRLVFTSAALDERGEPLFEVLDTVTFVEREGRTTLTLQSEITTVAPGGTRYLAGMERGWTESLERLAAHVTQGSSAARKGELNEATSDREIVLSRDVDAPRVLVWEAFTSPGHVGRWWGPDGFTTTIEEMDVRPGGHWKHVMHGPYGTDYPNLSVFREVVAPEHIAYSHGGGRKGTGTHFDSSWSFEALGRNRTKVTMRMVFPSAAERDRVIEEFDAVEGGRQTLARLADYLAATRGGPGMNA